MSPADTSPAHDKAAFLARLREFEGREVSAPAVPRDPVNEPMIHHWCDAMGDDNPVYTDADLAVASVHGGIVAPPTMLQAWSMPGLRPPADAADTELHRLRGILADTGYPAVIATNYDQEYVRYLRPGDSVSYSSVIESVSEEKGTGLGAGHFVTIKSTYHDAAGELVGTSTMRILCYRPKAPSTPSQPAAGGFEKPKRKLPARGRDNAFFWEGADAGELRIQRCASCGLLRHPPAPMCHRCHSLEWDWAVSSGRGTVHSFVVYHRPAIPPFEAPYVVALVELEEGTRLVSNIRGIDPADVKIDMPVECHFDQVQDDLVLPIFYPAGTATAAGVKE